MPNKVAIADAVQELRGEYISPDSVPSSLYSPISWNVFGNRFAAHKKFWCSFPVNDVGRSAASGMQLNAASPLFWTLSVVGCSIEMNILLKCSRQNPDCNRREPTFVTVSCREREYGLVLPVRGADEPKMHFNRMFISMEQPTTESVQKSGDAAFSCIPDAALRPTSLTGKLHQNFLWAANRLPKTFQLIGEYNDDGTAVLHAPAPIQAMKLEAGEQKAVAVDEYLASTCRPDKAKFIGRSDDYAGMILLRGPGLFFYIENL